MYYNKPLVSFGNHETISETVRYRSKSYIHRMDHQRSTYDIWSSTQLMNFWMFSIDTWKKKVQKNLSGEPTAPE